MAMIFTNHQSTIGMKKKYFNKAKEIEAYIEDLIADSDNSKII